MISSVLLPFMNSFDMLIGITKWHNLVIAKFGLISILSVLNMYIRHGMLHAHDAIKLKYGYKQQLFSLKLLIQ